jgi:hypothetical protein
MTVSHAREPSRSAHAKYELLIAGAKLVLGATTVVVHPCDETSGCGRAWHGRS